jgi:hypothetical protein
MPSAVGRTRSNPPPAVRVPVDRAIADPPDDVLAHVVGGIGLELLTHVIADAAGGDLRDEIRSPLDVAIFANSHLPGMLGLDEQEAVRLWLILRAEPHGAVVADLHARRTHFVRC